MATTSNTPDAESAAAKSSRAGGAKAPGDSSSRSSLTSKEHQQKRMMGFPTPRWLLNEPKKFASLPDSEFKISNVWTLPGTTFFGSTFASIPETVCVCVDTDSPPSEEDTNQEHFMDISEVVGATGESPSTVQAESSSPAPESMATTSNTPDAESAAAKSSRAGGAKAPGDSSSRSSLTSKEHQQKRSSHRSRQALVWRLVAWSPKSRVCVISAPYVLCSGLAAPSQMVDEKRGLLEMATSVRYAGPTAPLLMAGKNPGLLELGDVHVVLELVAHLKFRS
ncbi:hypothetical protein ISCGN_018684 [Ixodes scapularis]